MRIRWHWPKKPLPSGPQPKRSLTRSWATTARLTPPYACLIDRIRALCGAADLILPNYTEAQILLQRQPQTELLTDEAAQALADELTALAPGAVVTGLPLGKYIGCAGSGKDRFLIKKLHISRSFPGTGDLYGAVLIGSLLQGNA